MPLYRKTLYRMSTISYDTISYGHYIVCPLYRIETISYWTLYRILVYLTKTNLTKIITV